jgi:hypothetical protein
MLLSCITQPSQLARDLRKKLCIQKPGILWQKGRGKCSSFLLQTFSLGYKTDLSLQG